MGCGTVIIKTTVELLSLAIILVPYLLLDLLGVPVKRGFFCNDVTINYSYKGETFTTAETIIIVTVLVLIVISIGDGILPIFCNRSKSTWCLKQLLIGYRHVYASTLAAVAALSVGQVLKFSVGELRPCFIERCVPDFSRVNCTDNFGRYLYIEEDVCTSTSEYSLTQIRLSFPSDHAGGSAAAMVYIMIYIQSLPALRSFNGFRWLLHVASLCFLAVIGASRITDNVHHLHDVIAGWVIGTVIGCFAWYTLSPMRQRELLLGLPFIHPTLEENQPLTAGSQHSAERQKPGTEETPLIGD